MAANLSRVVVVAVRAIIRHRDAALVRREASVGIGAIEVIVIEAIVVIVVVVAIVAIEVIVGSVEIVETAIGEIVVIGAIVMVIVIDAIEGRSNDNCIFRFKIQFDKINF